MTREGILNQLANSEWLKSSCKSIAPANSEDLYQEFFVFVCQQSEEYLIKRQPYIKWWAISVLVKIANPSNVRKKFYKDFIHRHSDITTEPKHSHERNINEELLAAREKVLNDPNLYWFDREIYILFEGGERYSAIARRTKIHHKTVKESIENITNKIRKEYESMVANNIYTLFDDFDC
jgi:hypothetical protein